MIVESEKFGSIEECVKWLDSLTEKYDLKHFQIIPMSSTIYVVAMYIDWLRK